MGDGCTHYLDCANVYTAVYIGSNVVKCIPSIYANYCNSMIAQ